VTNIKEINVRERIVLAIRRDPNERDDDFHSRREELVGLCEAAGGHVVGVLVQERNTVDAKYYLGSGKIHELAERVQSEAADVVIFDGELSPAQVRNLEASLGCRVIDRTQLILDIFARRARTKEGRLQVEIAQLEYMLPRLTGRGTQMSRLGGGIGTRGPGETKLEVDRRRIRKRITHLREELKRVQRVRQTQRDKRGKSVPIVALVGYTNAGKTTLLGRWTDDRGTGNAHAGDSRLFDTLDPTARRVKAGATGEIVILDTVGFVQNLPHLLIDAFRATLEEVLAADVIVHVVEATTDVDTHLRTTYEVLGEIGALDKPVITFINKMDIATHHVGPDMHAKATVYGSAKTGENLDQLYELVDREVGYDAVHLSVEGRVDSKPFWDKTLKSGKVIGSTPVSEDRIRVTLEVERRLAPIIQEQLSRTPEVVVEFGWNDGTSIS
jgi:GTP-binding protein HflX